MPAANNVQNIFGNVNKSNPRRPKVSIVHTAGHAKRKLTRPKPKEASKACFSVAPPSLKIVDE
jgi:hypothetical protein